jgi:hypothetical protein
MPFKVLELRWVTIGAYEQDPHCITNGHCPPYNCGYYDAEGHLPGGTDHCSRHGVDLVYYRNERGTGKTKRCDECLAEEAEWRGREDDVEGLAALVDLLTAQLRTTMEQTKK